MYPTYYTYNPSRMRKAEKAYLKQGKNEKYKYKACAKLHSEKLIVHFNCEPNPNFEMHFTVL